MTAKRFIYNNGFVCDNQTGSCYEMFKNQDGREMADLLNHLHEEKEIDEKCYKELLQRYDKLKEENEQLKQRIEDYNKALKTLQDAYERQRLKNQLRRIWND